MAGERHETWESPLALRYGYEVLDHGFTAVPNILLQAYRDLGLDDQEAMFVVHLLTRKREKQDLSFRLADLPMTCSAKTRKRCLQSLRDKGLVFTRRIYQPGFPARIRHIELDLTNLLHNLVRWSQREEDAGPFVITLTPDVAQRVAAGHYHFVPAIWEARARELLAAATVPAQIGPVQETTPVPAQNGSVLAPVPTQFDPAPKDDLAGDTGRLFEPPGGPRGGQPARISPLSSGSADNPSEAAAFRTRPSSRPAVPEAVNAAPPHGMLAGRAAREPLPAEPLPVRRQRVLEDLRRAQGKPRREVAILTQNVAAVLGLDGGRRVIPERNDYGRVGALAKRFGAEEVWATACRIAGLGIDGDALAYLQRCLEQEATPQERAEQPERSRKPAGRAPACTPAQEQSSDARAKSTADPGLVAPPPEVATALPKRRLPWSAGNGQQGLGQIVLGAGYLHPNQPPERSTYIANLVMDISLQFGDTEHYRENDAQAHNLWRASGLDDQAFVQLVYQARDTALRLAGARNRMAYFFTVLRHLVQPDAVAAGGPTDERGTR
ncbi:MAG: hypothetical protein JW900_04890 [Anaerolineae bacterium]|nr:hypothetical protein [Anaerolineae bacterium]